MPSSPVSRIQATPQAELRLGEILSFLRAVGVRRSALELRSLDSPRPEVTLADR